MLGAGATVSAQYLDEFIRELRRDGDATFRANHAAPVIIVTRAEGEPFAMSIGGQERKVAHEGARHSAIYEIDGPQVLISPDWAKAVEAGRWPTQVRPFTRNRRHALYRIR